VLLFGRRAEDGRFVLPPYSVFDKPSYWCRKEGTVLAFVIVLTLFILEIQGCNQKFPDSVDNEINNSNKHSLRSNTMGYGVKTH
jgi:uncharacterized membrane protein